MKEEEYKKDKEVIENIKNLYIQIENENKEQQSDKTIEGITYYKDLVLVQPNEEIDGLAEQDVYLVKLLNQKQKELYDLYTNEMKIASIGEDGKATFSKDYVAQLSQRDPRFKDIIEHTKKEEKFKFPEELNPEDMQLTKDDIDEEITKESDEKNDETKKISQNPDTENKNNEEQEQENEDKDLAEERKVKKIATELGVNKEDINSCSEINPAERVSDNKTFENVAGVGGKYSKIFVIGSGKEAKDGGRFTFVGMTNDGKVEKIKSLQTRGTTTTDKNIISINRDGSTVKGKQVTEMFATQNTNENLSVTIGQYGTLEVDYLRRSPENNKFVGSSVATEHLRPTTKQVRELMSDSKTSTQDINKIVENANEQTENDGDATITNVDLNPNNDEYDKYRTITLHDGKETTLNEEAIKHNMTYDEYVNTLSKSEGDCPAEKIYNTNEKIAETAKKTEGDERAEEQEEEEDPHWRGRLERETPEEAAEREGRENSNDEE